MAKLRGNSIRERRLALGITQEDFAKASVLFDIAKVLKCHMEDFF